MLIHQLDCNQNQGLFVLTEPERNSVQINQIYINLARKFAAKAVSLGFNLLSSFVFRLEPTLASDKFTSLVWFKLCDRKNITYLYEAVG